MDEQNQTATPAADAPKTEISVADLQKMVEKQREDAANDWLQRVSALLNRKVNGFMLVAIGPNTDGSIGVDRLGIVMGEIPDYRAILAEANILHTQIQTTLMRMPIPAAAAVPPMGMELVVPVSLNAPSVALDKGTLDQHAADFHITDAQPVTPAEPAASDEGSAQQ